MLVTELEPSGSQNGLESEPTDAELAEFVPANECIELGFPASSPSGASEFVPASELVELGVPASSSSVVEPPGVLASSSASSELIELGFPVSSSSSHVDDLQGHPSGVEPTGSFASVAASSHLT